METTAASSCRRGKAPTRVESCRASWQRLSRLPRQQGTTRRNDRHTGQHSCRVLQIQCFSLYLVYLVDLVYCFTCNALLRRALCAERQIIWVPPRGPRRERSCPGRSQPEHELAGAHGARILVLDAAYHGGELPLLLSLGVEVRGGLGGLGGTSAVGLVLLGSQCRRVGAGNLVALFLGKSLLIDREFDGISGSASPQVVHARLESLLPGVEVERRQLAKVGIRHVDVERLGLVDVRAPVGSHVDQDALFDLPDSLVDGLEVVWDFQLHHGAIRSDHLVLDRGVPQSERRQIVQQVLVDHGELTRQHAPHVDVGRVRLEALVVAENLGGGGRGHRCNEERVPHPMRRDVCAKLVPVPPGRRGDAPHVRLKDALGDGGSLVRLVGAINLGQLTGSPQGGVVNRLKDLLVELRRLRGVERQSEQDKGVREALDPQSDGAMPRV
mmetsp:Transcript_8651/g.23493  ORF Transcript_8651/g.23493 Transcript_8651/m.23493 type:complete len:441 (+) Transcript_8651:1767-3089(+)